MQFNRLKKQTNSLCVKDCRRLLGIEHSKVVGISRFSENIPHNTCTYVTIIRYSVSAPEDNNFIKFYKHLRMSSPLRSYDIIVRIVI